MKTNHNPKYKYDCGNCKFNWCCGYTCACALKDMPDSPEWLAKSLKIIHKLIDDDFKLRNTTELQSRLILIYEKYPNKYQNNIDITILRNKIKEAV